MGAGRLSVEMATPDPTNDTSTAAANAQLAALRRMGASGRLRAGLRYSRSMIALARAALRRRHPDTDARTLLLIWIAESYGAELAAAVEKRMGAAPWTTATISS